MGTAKAQETDKHGRPATPYAVICHGPWDLPGNGHGKVYLTKAEYDRQMNAPNTTWRCPLCRYEADWDDANYEQALDAIEARSARRNMSAAEAMLGELPAGVEPHNFRDTAGPAESQLYLDELEDERDEG